MPPAKKQRDSAASDHHTRQMPPTDYNTMTPSAYTRETNNDTKTHSNQLTARMLTWEDKRVSAPDLNLQIDGDQSVQTSAEQWDQSEAKEINSLIQIDAVSPIHNGQMQIELNKRSRRTNQRLHWLHNNYNEADFFTKQLPTPLYQQTRRNLEASESSSYCSLKEIENIRGLSGSRLNYLWKITPNPPSQ